MSDDQHDPAGFPGYVPPQDGPLAPPPPPVATQYSLPPVGAQGRVNGFGIAALILGIFGFLVGVIPFFIGLILGFLPTVLAIVLGIVGIARSRAGGGRYGPALAGLIIGGITFLAYFVGYGTLW